MSPLSAEHCRSHELAQFGFTLLSFCLSCSHYWPIVTIHVGVLRACCVALCEILLLKEPAFGQDFLLTGKQRVKTEMILCQVEVNNQVKM